MMTQPSGLSPIASHGTRQSGPRAKSKSGGERAKPQTGRDARPGSRGADGRAGERTERARRESDRNSAQPWGACGVSQVMLHRLVLTLAASAAALSAVPAAAAAALPAGSVTSAGSLKSLGPVMTYVEPLLLGPAQSPAVSRSASNSNSRSALMPPPARDEDSRDRLTVTVHDAGNGADGTYELRCHPGAGSHPDVSGACDALDRGARWGKDPFAPVSPGAMCTMQYGGPATAHVTGTWAGRPVDARFDRGDGCQIARWNALAPLLPNLRS